MYLAIIILAFVPNLAIGARNHALDRQDVSYLVERFSPKVWLHDSRVNNTAGKDMSLGAMNLMLHYFTEQEVVHALKDLRNRQCSIEPHFDNDVTFNIKLAVMSNCLKNAYFSRKNLGGHPQQIPVSVQVPWHLLCTATPEIASCMVESLADVMDCTGNGTQAEIEMTAFISAMETEYCTGSNGRILAVHFAAAPGCANGLVEFVEDVFDTAYWKTFNASPKILACHLMSLYRSAIMQYLHNSCSLDYYDGFANNLIILSKRLLIATGCSETYSDFRAPRARLD